MAIESFLPQDLIDAFNKEKSKTTDPKNDKTKPAGEDRGHDNNDTAIEASSDTEKRRSKPADTVSDVETDYIENDSGDELEQDEDDSTDFSEDDLEEIISGKKTAKPKKEESEEDYYASEEEEIEDDIAVIKAELLEENEDLQEIEQYLKQIGKGNKALDSIIESVQEKVTVGKNKLINKLQEDVEKTEKVNKAYALELERLKDLERTVRFDNLDVVKETYLNPMENSKKIIHKLLVNDGAEFTAEDALALKNRTEFNNMLANLSLSTQEANLLYTHWQNYRSLKNDYEVEKVNSNKNIAKYLGSEIPENTVKSLFSEAIQSVARTHSDKQYIDNYFNNKATTAEKERSLDVITRANGNFKALVGAISNPTDTIKSREFLSKIATFCIQAEHANSSINTLEETKKELESTKSKLVALAKQYKKLIDQSGTTFNTKKLTKRADLDVKTTNKKSNKYLSEEEKINKLTKVQQGNLSFIEMLNGSE
jgi:hypothetical protein